MTDRQFKNLRDFIKYLETKGQLKRITAEVDTDLEITEIADRMVKKGGPALLFENVKGSKFPLAINLFAGYDRISWALNATMLDDIPARLLEMLPDEMPGSWRDKLSALAKLGKLASLKPKEVKKAPCQEVVQTESFDLNDLPVLKCWPDDGGRFITLPLVITKNQNTGVQNVGMYRMQVFDGRTTGMHWHIHHDGAENFRSSTTERFEIAVALGGDPATIYSATAPVPKGFDELFFAGLLRGRPIDVIKAKTVDLLVPAEAEFIIEGYVNHGETRREGPFGDHTGYYSLADDFPVLHVTCITHRAKPIYPATIVGKPPMEDCYMAKATERLFLPVLKAAVPEIIDMNLPLEGVFHNCAIISINKSYPKHANKVAHAIWGMGQMMFTKMIIIVDASVNAQDTSEVLWKVFNNVDPKRDILFTEGPLDMLDHSSPTPNYGSKICIDATKKWPSEGHIREWPDDIKMSDAIVKLVDEKWKTYGFE